MSEIVQIYNSLANLSVSTSGGVAPIAYNLSALPEAINTAHLPCRLLLPVNANPGEGREGMHIALGTGMSIIWQLNDLMLWQTSEQGVGLREYAPILVDYSGKYLDAMRVWGKCPYQNSTLEGVAITPSEYEWPRGSGRFYAGVLCQLQIREVLSG